MAKLEYLDERLGIVAENVRAEMPRFLLTWDWDESADEDADVPSHVATLTAATGEISDEDIEQAAKVLRDNDLPGLDATGEEEDQWSLVYVEEYEGELVAFFHLDRREAVALNKALGAEIRVSGLLDRLGDLYAEMWQEATALNEAGHGDEANDLLEVLAGAGYEPPPSPEQALVEAKLPQIREEFPGVNVVAQSSGMVFATFPWDYEDEDKGRVRARISEILGVALSDETGRDAPRNYGFIATPAYEGDMWVGITYQGGSGALLPADSEGIVLEWLGRQKLDMEVIRLDGARIMALQGEGLNFQEAVAAYARDLDMGGTGEALGLAL